MIQNYILFTSAPKINALMTRFLGILTISAEKPCPTQKDTHVYTQIERLDETNTELQTELKLDNSTKSYGIKG